MSTLSFNRYATIGALQIGSYISVFLFGVVTVQCHLYIQRFQDDRWGYKALVTSVWLFELGHTICIAYEVYRATVIHYGQPEELVMFPGLAMTIFLGGIITVLVQNFFAYRAWKIMPNPYKYVALGCMAVSLVRFVAGCYVAVKGIVDSLIKFRDQNKALISALLIVGVVVDVTVAFSMTLFLVKKRGNAHNKLARLLDSLVMWTIRTGLVTSIAALAMLITFQLWTDTMIWMCLHTFLAKLYSNSFLSALNARHTLRNKLSKSVSGDIVRAPPIHDLGLGDRSRRSA
ncbi:hypothetical protein AX17_005572, partial [Amanita inopinata Kibby_2008]